MKFITFICLFTLSFLSYSQTIEKFYDYNWKETDASNARFYSVVKKTDSGWHRIDFFLHEKNNIQMDGTYLDSLCKIKNGTFYFLYYNNRVKSYGKYINDKKQGLWLSYHPNGMMSDSAYYENGKIIGVAEKWYSNGYIEDSIFVNNGIITEVSWYDDGIISSAGRYAENGEKIGNWKFFHHNGKIASLETYNNGILINKNYFNENGNNTDTSNIDKPAEFIYKGKKWSDYISSKLYFPTQYKITNSDKAAVMVEFTVNETGKIEDINIVTPFYEPFNDIVVNVLRNSPPWKPAVLHNRFVKQKHRQVVTFKQDEY